MPRLYRNRHIDVHKPIFASYSQHYAQLDSNQWLQARVNAPAYRNQTICPELVGPQFNDDDPWMNPRLPSYIKPLNYKIEILFTNFDTYNGLINITFNLNESNNLILFHSAINEMPLIQYMLNNANNIVDIECVGTFTEYRNDYYVLRTTK